MIIKLKRFSYSRTETEGVMIVGDTGLVLRTIEQPWVPNPNGAKGGKPFESCIPDGMYRLSPHERPTKEGADAEVYIIHNDELGVYRFPQDHEEFFGRNLCLIHKANWATQIQGCIAPGMTRYPMVDKRTGKIEQAVGHSGTAMAKLREALGREGHHILSITNETGASDVGR